jgi:hypothetical protein
MSVEPGTLDANVLDYAINADAPQHAASRALVEAWRCFTAEACFLMYLRTRFCGSMSGGEGQSGPRKMVA